MKIDLTNWEENKKRIFFLIVCPMALSTVIQIFVGPAIVEISPKIALLTPLLSAIVFVPFMIVEVRRNKAETARENRELQAKHDAEDKAMFGKPLRELEL